MDNYVKNSLFKARDILIDFCNDEINIRNISLCAKKMSEAITNDGKIIICGNGGSLTDAMHFAEELTGRFRNDRRPLPAISLADPSHITCVANDYGFEEIFSRSVEALGMDNDVFVGLSTSGNSQNIIKAFNVAKSKKLTTVLFLGKKGGFLKGKADYEFLIEADTSDRIQEIHMLILHILVEGIEKNMNF